MHEHHVYIYVVDQNYMPTQKQIDKATLFFEIIVAEAEHRPYGWENAEIPVNGGSLIESPFALTAGFLCGSNKYWLINASESADDADEEDYDELAFGTQLRSEVMRDLEQFLGTKLALVWVFGE